MLKTRSPCLLISSGSLRLSATQFFILKWIDQRIDANAVNNDVLRFEIVHEPEYNAPHGIVAEVRFDPKASTLRFQCIVQRECVDHDMNRVRSTQQTLNERATLCSPL